jgi:MauM/NapG family ferredoxin protein
VKARSIRRVRQTVQIVSFAVLCVLTIGAIYLPQKRELAALFLRLDPLAGLTAMLAGRQFIPSMALGGLVLISALVFGRAWCGWICPTGTLLEWLSPRRSPALAEPPQKLRAVKYWLLAAILTAAALGNLSLMIFDPISLLNRTAAAAFYPALWAAVSNVTMVLYKVPVLTPVLDALYQGVIYPVFRELRPLFGAAVPVFLFFAVIAALNAWRERFWCRYLCPLGGLLGLTARFALLQRVVGEGCSSCGLCARRCPTGTINPEKGYQSDPAECTVCYNCAAVCARGSDHFEWRWKPAPSRAYDPQRREVLMVIGAAAAGVALTAVEPVTRRRPAVMIRPPGAEQTGFESLCIRCGACMRSCPTQGLQPAGFESGWQNLLTPVLMPRLGQCNYACNTCGEVCPTGAIPWLALEDKQRTPIGLARVDHNRCLPWAYNISCIICEEMCPVPQKAIHLEQVQAVNAVGEVVTLQRPSVVRELCIGCGICEFRCPLGGEAAIRVFSPSSVGKFLG